MNHEDLVTGEAYMIKWIGDQVVTGVLVDNVYLDRTWYTFSTKKGRLKVPMTYIIRKAP